MKKRQQSTLPSSVADNSLRTIPGRGSPAAAPPADASVTIDSEPASDSDIGQSLPQVSSSTDSESDSSGYESGELSEEEDQRPISVFPIGQPAEGWSEAERKAPGYSRTQVYKQKAYYHRNKDTLKRKREEKMAREAGIPVSKKAKPIYGNIALLFGARTKVSESSSSDPTAAAPATGTPSPPPVPATHTGAAATATSHAVLPVHSYIPPDFEESFQTASSFEAEAQDLDIWLKKNKEQVTGDWLLRVECLRDLLRVELKKGVSLDLKRRDWVHFSKALARRVKRSTKWAGLLRHWERQWVETRTPPPYPRRGRHIKRKTLFYDEGV